MKYNTGKIKTEHNILPEFKNILKNIEKIEQVKRIIPWRISRKQKWSSHKKMTFSYNTKSWMKFIMKKWSTAQELFIICDNESKEDILNKILDLNL